MSESSPTILGPDGQPIKVLPSAVDEYQELQKQIGTSAVFLCKGRGPLSAMMVEVKSAQAEVQALALTLAQAGVLDVAAFNANVLHFLRGMEGELRATVSAIQEHILAQAAVENQKNGGQPDDQGPQTPQTPAPEAADNHNTLIGS